MDMPPLQRISLSTGVDLDVAIAGDPANPALIFLHGFPESHRTWRHQFAEFARDYHVIAPDQRGYAGSSKPEGVENYAADKPVADLLALADALGVDRFTLVGHDWGGAIAWLAALRHPDRVARLVIINAPHPLIFQRSMFDGSGQRRASQYMRFLRDTTIDQGLIGKGLEAFFDSIFVKHLVSAVAGHDRAAYLDEWGHPGAMTAMLNWYRAGSFIVPETDDTETKCPDWVNAPFPPVQPPTLVIWGMQDKALMPVQLEGLDALVPHLTIVRVPDAAHFVPWEDPESVNRAMRAWLAENSLPEVAAA